MKLVSHHYGKACVRVMKVIREGARHHLKELEVKVMLQGDFESSFTRGDNSLVVATDTMKNTVNLLAKEKLGPENEVFGLVLGGHFLRNYPQVGRVEISIAEHCWERLMIAGAPHAHSFTEKGAARPFTTVVSSRQECRVESGIEDLLILKTTGSGFEGFARDKFTTLPETKDRIFATKLKATWSYEATPASYTQTNETILQAMLGVFAETYSPSVQTTLFQMGEAALASAPEISRITIAMPNKHCLLVNLGPLGAENHNELFVPTDEPHGQIEGTVTRDVNS